MGAFVVGFTWFCCCFHFVKSSKAGRSQMLSALVIIVVRCALLMSVSCGVLWCGVNFHNFCSLLCVWVCGKALLLCSYWPWRGRATNLIAISIDRNFRMLLLLPSVSLFPCSSAPLSPWQLPVFALGWGYCRQLSPAFVSQRPFVSFRIITGFAFGHFVAELFSDSSRERDRRRARAANLFAHWMSNESVDSFALGDCMVGGGESGDSGLAVKRKRSLLPDASITICQKETRLGSFKWNRIFVLQLLLVIWNFN